MFIEKNRVLMDWLKSNRKVLGVISIAVLALLVSFVHSSQQTTHFEQVLINSEDQAEQNLNQQEIVSDIGEEESVTETVSTIYVDIKGAVQKPDVYALPQGSRVFDIINEAGGLTTEAADEYINLAQLLSDQMMIYVYSEEELAENQQSIGNSELPFMMGTGTLPLEEESAETRLININSASASELEQLPNIGPKKAAAIIQYRNDHGSFGSIEEIMNVSGIGLKTYEQLAALITAGS